MYMRASRAFRATFPRMEKKKGEKETWRRFSEEKNVEERFQYMPRDSETAVHGNAFESLIVLRKHIFLLLPILRRRALVSL